MPWCRDTMCIPLLVFFSPAAPSSLSAVPWCWALAGHPVVHVASGEEGRGVWEGGGLAFGSPAPFSLPPHPAPPRGPTPPDASAACPTHVAECVWEPGCGAVDGKCVWVGGVGRVPSCTFSLRHPRASPGSQIFCVGSWTPHKNICGVWWGCGVGKGTCGGGEREGGEGVEEERGSSQTSHPLDPSPSRSLFSFLPPSPLGLVRHVNVGFTCFIRSSTPMVGVTVPAAIVACRAILPHRQQAGRSRASRHCTQACRTGNPCRATAAWWSCLAGEVAVPLGGTRVNRFLEAGGSPAEPSPRVTSGPEPNRGVAGNHHNHYPGATSRGGIPPVMLPAGREDPDLSLSRERGAQCLGHPSRCTAPAVRHRAQGLGGGEWEL